MREKQSKSVNNQLMSIRLADIKQFESLDLLARQLVEGFITGLHKSPYHGFSVEFAEHKTVQLRRKHSPCRLESLRTYGQVVH